MRNLLSSPILFIVACSGAGVSTTARTTTDSVPMDTDASVTGASADDSDAEDDTDPSAADDDPSAAEDGDDTSTGGSEVSGTPEEESDADDTMPEEVTFEGNWLSEGDNIAPLLVELTGAVSINATFGPQAFTVDTVDDQGQMVQQVGVYTATPSGVGEIFEITLEQTMPQAITVEGIFEIDDSVSPAIMRYEVVQTEPTVGAAAPTAEGGFGSTSLGSDLTQIYVRQ